MVQQKQCIINELGFVIKVKENITIRFPAWKNNFRNCVIINLLNIRLTAMKISRKKQKNIQLSLFVFLDYNTLF